MTINYRMADGADESGILEFLVALIGESRHTQYEPLDADGLPGRLSAMLALSMSGFFVAEEHGRIIGLYVLVVSPDLISGTLVASQVCWYVSPGRRDGTGLRLQSLGELWAIGRGCQWLDMPKPGPNYDGWMRRRGFSVVHEVCRRRLTPCLG